MGRQEILIISVVPQVQISIRCDVSRDEEMDGEWEAPQIPNPACETAPGCGRWKPPMINNPEYKGKWKPPLVDNPNYQVGHLLTPPPSD